MAEADAVATAMVTGASPDNPDAATQHNQAGANGSVTGGDWGTVPDELKKVVEGKGWKAPSDAVKSYVELEKFASKSVQDMSPEEREKFAKTRLGRPEKPDELPLSNVTLPEGFPKPDKASEDELRKVVWSMQSLPLKEQAKYLHEWATKKAVEAFISMRSADGKRREESETKLRQTWALDYEGNNTKVDKLLALGGDELVQWANNGPGKDPVVRMGLLKIAKLFSDETLVTGAVPPATQGDAGGFVVDFSKSPELVGDKRFGHR